MTAPIYPAAMHACRGTTRLAPSPTGSLHLGHACSFLATWALARSNGWRLLLRLDDLDAPRVRSGGLDLLDTLRWLGLDWDGEPVRQSARLDRYIGALRTLAASGHVFESPQSRQEVREAAAAVGAPHEGEGHVIFPAALRPADPAAWRGTRLDLNHRFRVDAGEMRLDDQLLGPHVFEPARQHGDFLVWTKAGVPSYQLACAVDDAELGMTEVVRGADLLESAALQTLLLHALGHGAPRWWHLPLVRDGQGRRLAKRDGSEGLESLRRAGVGAERIRGLVAWWLGAPRLEPASATELLTRVSIDGLRSASRSTGGPRADAAALAWLHGDATGTATLDRHAGGSAVD